VTDDTTSRPATTSCYIRPPDFLAKKRRLVNVRSFDQFCFVWAILAALFQPQHNPSRVQHYEDYLCTLNLDGLDFPVQNHHIAVFEKNNPSITVNVVYFDSESNRFLMEYISPNRGRQNHINLLAFNGQCHKHYTWIKTVSRLFTRSSMEADTRHFMFMCVDRFATLKALEMHISNCSRCTGLYIQKTH